MTLGHPGCCKAQHTSGMPQCHWEPSEELSRVENLASPFRTYKCVPCLKMLHDWEFNQLKYWKNIQNIKQYLKKNCICTEHVQTFFLIIISYITQPNNYLMFLLDQVL